MSVPPFLWHVMRTANGEAERLREFCASATQEQLIMLYRLFGIAAGQLHSTPRFQARAEPDQAWKLACWVVSQGQNAWRAAMRNPDDLPTRVPDGAPDFQEIMASVYAERFGSPIPDQEPEPVLRGFRPTAEWEERLMDVIDLVKDGIPIEEVLGAFTRSELIHLHVALRALTERLKNEFTPPLGADPEGLDWLRWAAWFVGQGRDEWATYRAHPDRLPRRAPPEAALFSDELQRVYRGRYGARLPTHLSLMEPGQ